MYSKLLEIFLEIYDDFEKFNSAISLRTNEIKPIKPVK